MLSPEAEADLLVLYDYAGEGDEFTTVHSTHAISITGMKLAIISKAAPT